jgi:hypothetical protein
MRAQFKIGFILCVAWCLLTHGNAEARLIESWPYDKLFKHAELVLIVKAASVRDAEPRDQAIPAAGWKDILVGVVTNMQILQVVKGDCKEKTLDLIHFRLKEGAQIRNGPLLVSFSTKPIVLQVNGWTIANLESHYMLFLKKNKDGRLECVSGQLDPELSVKQIMGTLP